MIFGMVPVAGRKVDAIHRFRQFAKALIGHEMEQMHALYTITDLLKILGRVVDKTDGMDTMIEQRLNRWNL